MIRLNPKPLSRRDFLKLASVGVSAFALPPLQPAASLPEFPTSERLGRVLPLKVEVKARPDVDSQTVAAFFEDDVLPWLREVPGIAPGFDNQRWIEVPQGFIRSPFMQPVRSQPVTPVDSLPETSQGPGMWVEVCVPYVNVQLVNPTPRSPRMKEMVRLGLPLRLYYSQVMWADRIKIAEDGTLLYRINEKYGTYGDMFWADGRAFRRITPEEVAPISPEVEDKRIVVDLTYQTLACFEGAREVYFARVSTGVNFDPQGNPSPVSSTPLGNLTIWRKLISLHMSGGSSGAGWDLSGVAWTTLFAGNGVAIHSTYWHNSYGIPMSRGCVNASPADSKWVFRWSSPIVEYDPGELTVQWPGGTRVEVKKS
jgi:hypothetical protein